VCWSISLFIRKGIGGEGGLSIHENQQCLNCVGASLWMPLGSVEKIFFFSGKKTS